jgi:hypothetical protein
MRRRRRLILRFVVYLVLAAGILATVPLVPTRAGQIVVLALVLMVLGAVDDRR